MEGAFTLLECADVSKTTIRAASIWQSHSVRPHHWTQTQGKEHTHKQGIGFYVPRPQLCLVVKIALSINISTSSSSSWLISWANLKSPACEENYQQQTNNQSRMDLAITQCQTTSTIRDLADGRLGQHYPRPRRWTLGQHYPRPRRWTLQHYPRPRRWTLTQGMEQTRCHGHAWQLTLFWMRRSK